MIPKERAQAKSDSGGRGYAGLYLALLSILGCFVVSVVYVNAFAVNVFFADEWDFVPLLRRAQAGTLGAGDLLAHHNEHVYLFPWGLMLLLGSATSYDTVPLMYGVLLCLLLTALVLLMAISGDAKGRSRAYPLLFVPVPFLVFSLRQYENMLWGNQISFGLAQSFSVLSLYLLHACSGLGGVRRTAAFSAGLLAATVASFSAVQGLLIWPAGLLLLLVSSPSRAAKGGFVVGWALAGAAQWAVYLSDYDRPRGAPSVLYGAEHPLEGLRYFVSLLGASLFHQEAAAFWAGLALLTLLLAGLFLLLRERRIPSRPFWLGLLVFALLSLVSITAGRVGFPDEALFARTTVSRYATFSLLAVVSTYAIFASLAWLRRSVATLALFGILSLLIVASVPLSYGEGLEAGRLTETSRERMVSVLADHRSQPAPAFSIFGNDPQRVKRYAHVLDRLDQSVFAGGDLAGGPPAVPARLLVHSCLLSASPSCAAGRGCRAPACRP
jgi:hypothetical protein